MFCLFLFLNCLQLLTSQQAGYVMNHGGLTLSERERERGVCDERGNWTCWLINFQCFKLRVTYSLTCMVIVSFAGERVCQLVTVLCLSFKQGYVLFIDIC